MCNRFKKKIKTFGKSFKIILSDKNCLSLYVPEGFAHAYYSFDPVNIVYYKLTNYYKPEFESGINLLDKKLRYPGLKKSILFQRKIKSYFRLTNFCKNYKYL